MSFWKKPVANAEWLRGVAFFEGFTDDELTTVATHGAEVEVPAGTVLIDQGDTGIDCYVILEGLASVYVAGEHVTTLGSGTMVGEMALVDHRPRNASVMTDTDMRLLRFNSAQFRDLLDTMPKAQERVMALLSARLKQRGS